METWEKVTTRSRVSIYRTNDPMETIAAIGLKLDQDERHTHIWKKKTTLCPVTVLIDSQVSDRCPWATCPILNMRNVHLILIKMIHVHTKDFINLIPWPKWLAHCSLKQSCRT